ncbi:MAG: DNA polymerase III subunit gamma/tau [Ruminococcus sp.]|nr:DNA polymerase III subunit gamma/tau [Ruminococcus sp.]
MYTALYRKWRPLSFDDVISQPHITQTLKNQIKNNKTAHAYLFTGSRGTGKTTCARIFAKAVNCPDELEGNPCLKCGVCVDADNFALSDIIEIDAASNNGVDDIRDLRDGAVYTPERCRYKVYIIDEVHMLTPNAFNALLKIMEEPPAYVKFILATTEVHKVPATITSRCQRFDFRRILTQDIKERLLYIAQQESLELSEDAAMLIARLSDGGMRDALSLLDQCAAYSEDITSETVSAAAGIAGRDSLFEIIEAAVSKNTGEALSVTDRLYSMSKDMSKLCTELIDQFRNLMLMKVCPEKTELIACMPDELERLRAIASKTELADILSKLTVLQECSEKMGRALNKRVEFEMCLIKLCSAKSQHKAIDNSENYGKINTEKRVQTESPVKPETAAEPEGQETVKPAVDMKTLKASDFKPLIEWAEILEELTKVSPSVSGALSGSRAYVHKNIMLIDTKNQFFLRLFKIPENFACLNNAIKNVMGRPYALKARCTAAAAEEQKADDLIKKAIDSGIETAVE